MPIRDTRMMARAVTQRWPISNEYRASIIRRLMRVLADPASSPREVTAAAKALIAAESQNQSDEHKVVDIELRAEHDRLDAIAADLGIEIDFIEATARASGGGVGGDADGGN